MARLSDYVSYMLISVIWLILELVLTRYPQCSNTALLGIIINVISMIVVSYKYIYSRYLFILNMALLTIMGFLVPPGIIMPYIITLIISIVLYLLLIGMLEPYSLILSLLIIYLSYIIEKMLMKVSAFYALETLVKEVGVNVSLFMTLFTWYLSLFIISIIIALLIILLSKKVLTPSS